MKKAFTFLTLILFFVGLNSQITITSSNIVSPGKVFERAYDDYPDASIKPGNAGASQTWDFSALDDDGDETVVTMNPEWTPFGMFFPYSNLAFYSPEDTTYVFLENNANSLILHGMYGIFFDSIQMPMVYSPPLVMAEYPVQYQDQKNSHAVFQFGMPITGVPGIDSAKIKMDIIIDTDVDAWGTITTPLGTFDALRMYTYEEDYDSVWFKAGGYWSLWESGKEILDSYAWWSNSSAAGYPLVEFNYWASNDSVADVSFLKSSPTQSISKNNHGSLLGVFPNPADNYIYFDFDGDTEATLEVYDNLGKLILEQNIGAKEMTKISTEDLSPGMYIYNLIGSNRLVIEKGKFCKQ